MKTVLRCMLLAKIHRATVTDTNLNYEGSITIPRDVVEAAGLLPGEHVLVANLATGERFSTYVMIGSEPGRFCLNGAAARLGASGDRIIIMAFGWLDAQEATRHRPRIVLLDEANRILKVEGPQP